VFKQLGTPAVGVPLLSKQVGRALEAASVESPAAPLDDCEEDIEQ
jgi:hypothetical protein